MSFVLASGSSIAGRYRLDRLLGQGGMGQVWAAQHLLTGRFVAVKFLLSRDLDDRAKTRLLREARASCAIRHHGVVPVLDVIESDSGEPALVMDLLEGESLARRLARVGRLSAREAVMTLLPAAEALRAAHEAGIVHRDLKPDNIFLTDAGETKVLDFGIAKLIHLEADVGRSAGTQTGAIIGTPAYMSPEQAFGEREIDGRSDIWSFGLIFFQCLTGVLPTAAENLGQVLKIILTTRIESVLDRAPSTPAGLADLIMKMLSSERASRPETMTEVIDALNALDMAHLLRDETVDFAKDQSPMVAADVRTHGNHGASPAVRSKRSRFSMASAIAVLLLTGTVIMFLSRAQTVSPSGDIFNDPANAADPAADTPSTPAAESTASAPYMLAITVEDPSAHPLPQAAAGSSAGKGRRPMAHSPATPSSVNAGASAAQPTRTKQTLQGAVAKDAPF